MLNSITILGTTITSSSKKNILEYCLGELKKKRAKFSIVTPNPEIVVYAKAHPEYRRILNEAKVALPDGVGLLLASKLLGKHLQGRFTGVDFIEKLCEAYMEDPLSMGFLGGKGGVAERTAECLKKKYPWINVSFVGEEWDTDDRKKEKPSASSHPSVTHIDILFVAFGFPKQEEWITQHLPNIPVTAAMGVGGAFDFISGQVPRAPYIIRYIGMEWFFRLLIQPWRIKRQIALLKFGWMVVEEFIKKKNKESH